LVRRIPKVTLKRGKGITVILVGHSERHCVTGQGPSKSVLFMAEIGRGVKSKLKWGVREG
jgi:hypothetical protein